MKKIKKVPDKKMHAGALIGIIMSIIMICIMSLFAIGLIVAFKVVSQHMSEAIKMFGLSGLTTMKIVAPIIIVFVITISAIIIWLCTNVIKGKTTNGLAAGITLLITSASIIPLGIVGIIGGVLLIIGKYETGKKDKDINGNGYQD